MTSVLIAGEVLRAGQRLETPSRAYSASMSEDGELTVRRNDDGSCVWSSGTAGHHGGSVVMHDGGELSIRTLDGRRVWTSSTGDHAGAFLQLHDDGQLVVHDFYRSPLWRSETRL